MKNKIQPPLPWIVLYNNLFMIRSRDESMNIISKGFNAILLNVKRLLLDVDVLVKSNKFSSAHFLLSTAREEIAKSYIFLDMCRLNFSKNESQLKCLCKAFYDHIFKYAYFEINNDWKFYNMKHVKDIWESETMKWWPNNDPTSGEPDMPHDTYFHREMPLYVDYIEYDQEWSIPDDTEETYHFKEILGGNIISKTSECFEKILFSDSIGLFNSRCLTILNDEFQNIYISEKTENSIIDNIYMKIALRLFTDQKIELESFNRSILKGWPLYHFLNHK